MRHSTDDSELLLFRFNLLKYSNPTLDNSLGLTLEGRLLVGVWERAASMPARSGETDDGVSGLKL